MGGIVQGATQLWASVEGAKAEQQANDLQRQREHNQAVTAINTATEKGRYDAGRRRMAGTDLTARQRGAYTASGVDATQGTAAAVQADTAALNELDAQQISINAAREAWAYREADRQGFENYKLNQKNINIKGTAGAIGGMSKMISGFGTMGMG